MISTATADTSALVSAGSGPTTNQTAKVAMAMRDHDRHEVAPRPVGQPLDRGLGAPAPAAPCG